MTARSVYHRGMTDDDRAERDRAELKMARDLLISLGTHADYLDWDAGWIDSALHITKAQETYWRSLLPAPETAV